MATSKALKDAYMRQQSIYIPIRVQAQIMPFMYVRSVVVVRLLRFLFFFSELWPAVTSFASLSAAGGFGYGLILRPPMVWPV